ncbi:hypothetical protein Peur_070239 [Populus x canadensis]
MPDYGLDPIISSKSSSCLRSCTWKLSIRMGARASQSLLQDRPLLLAVPVMVADDHEVSSQFKWIARWISPHGSLRLVQASSPTCTGGFHHVVL